MKVKNIIGALTITSVVTMIVLLALIMSQNVMVDALLVKLAIFNLVTLVAFCGLYILNQHCETADKINKAISILAVALIVFGGLSAFNILDIQSSWNLLIGVAIIYITIIQMQLLKWKDSKSLLKITGLLTLLSNVYIITYYLFKLNGQTAGSLLDITIVVSVFAFLIGLILSSKKKKVQH